MKTAATDSRDTHPLKLHHNVRRQGSESWRVAFLPAPSSDASTHQSVHLGVGTGRILKLLDTLKALWSMAPSDARTVSIFRDALEFAGGLPPNVALPRVWFDECEVVFEWIERGRHAVVSCEGDGIVGYTYRVNGTFQPGAIPAAELHSFPGDLVAYLTVG